MPSTLNRLTFNDVDEVRALFSALMLWRLRILHALSLDNHRLPRRLPLRRFHDVPARACRTFSAFLHANLTHNCGNVCEVL